jgi:hypothetical protein
MLQVCLPRYCICFQWFLILFASISDTCFKCFIYFVMLQVLRLDVSKVDRHVRSAWKAEGCPSGVPAQATFRWHGPSVGVGDVVTIE